MPTPPVRLAFALLVLGFATPALAQGPPEGFPDLVAGLRAVEGNLGVETAQTSSGKQVIFAWFADKAAVLRWYHSEMHRGVQDMFFPDRPPHEPLAHIADDSGPILAIASITPTDPAHAMVPNLPVSQISIELYAPLPGGLSVGGTFAPASLEIPHHMKAGEDGAHEHPAPAGQSQPPAGPQHPQPGRGAYSTPSSTGQTPQR